jgi:hypothetical protein
MSKTLYEAVKHDLEILMNEDVIAFFSVTVHLKPMGDDELEMLSTFNIFYDDLTRDEKIKLAEMIVNLGKKIREAALGR